MFTVRLLLAACAVSAAQPLPGTTPWAFEGDPATRMVDGIHTWLERETVAAREHRTQSPLPDRERLRVIIGATDQRVPFSALTLDATTASPAEAGRGAGYRVRAVRWPVFEGVEGEGLLLTPDRPPLARVVAIPDADQTPEALAAAWARRLAESGCEVLIPTLIDRASTWSGIPGARMTNQPHREWIYRMAFEVGRHIIGYEVQKVLAAVDWFERQGAAPVGVAGYGEGGLIAMDSAALDTRIRASLVSGYFGPRDGVWQEPIYRDQWGLLRDFGDAEIAGLIAPGALVVEASRPPEVAGPPPPTKDRRGAAPVGSITAAPIERIRAELVRVGRFSLKPRLVESPVPGSDAALEAFLQTLNVRRLVPPAAPFRDTRTGFDPAVRLHRQFDQLVAHTQTLVRQSQRRREAFRAQRTPSAMRDAVWNDVIGRVPDPTLPANPRTRRIFDTPKLTGYEVMLDVWPDVFAHGILLVPKGIAPGERRPVVVCQHGLEGRPRDVADPSVDSPYYHRFAVRLAEEGYITFSPQNPYIGEDRFRLIQRKAHPLKLSLFSFILGQHQRILEWLGELPFADRARIGFYGLSYGGKTAVRVPPLLEGYALSICSADFNEWVWKTTSIEAPFSYMVTQEYDMLEFDFANKVNYSDLANLMAPRPFMVERGHDDGVSVDEWVAYEYAKVRRFYDKLSIGDRTAIEFFNGPHTINGQGTFEFLRRHLGPAVK